MLQKVNKGIDHKYVILWMLFEIWNTPEFKLRRMYNQLVEITKWPSSFENK